MPSTLTVILPAFVPRARRQCTVIARLLRHCACFVVVAVVVEVLDVPEELEVLGGVPTVTRELAGPAPEPFTARTSNL